MIAWPLVFATLAILFVVLATLGAAMRARLKAPDDDDEPALSEK